MKKWYELIKKEIEEMEIGKYDRDYERGIRMGMIVMGIRGRLIDEKESDDLVKILHHKLYECK